MTTPYYNDDHITLYHGDWRDHSDSVTGDAIITDPPYGETPLPWDRWPTAWPEFAHPIAPAMWCFGSLRMFMQNAHDFRHWKFSHEIIWQKTTSTAIAADKFRRVHELAALWYHGAWNAIQHNVPKIEVGSPRLGRTYRKLTKTRSQTMSDIDLGEWHDDGTRYQTTIIEARNGHRRSIHPTQKPLAVITPLITYSVPEGGTVIDLFSGSGSIALAARQTGRKCIAYEINEAYCETSANRLAQHDLDFGDWDGAA